jgi:glycolate oxidase FAD binding subunit
VSAVATLGLDPARAADPGRYRIGDRAPRLALKPASSAEVAEALRAASTDQLGVIPWGGGSQLARFEAPERFDVALDLSALDRIVVYEPEDLTVTAECGITLGALHATLADRGQELPLESPHAARSTLGGTLATNASGPRRLRLGAPRDRILGARFALADGTLIRSGGQVVKNVAGFALHRLLCGSGGGLAVLLEASLKLLPGPEARVVLIYAATGEQLADAERWERLPRLDPAFATVLGRAAADALGEPEAARAPFAVAVGLEDDMKVVAQQERTLGAAWGPPVARLEGAEAIALCRRLTEVQDQAQARLTFTSPHRVPAPIAPLLSLAGVERLVFHAPAGRLHWFPESGSAQAIVRGLAEHGFVLIGARRAGDLEPVVAPQAAVRALRLRIREALDPGRVLALGERWAESL